MNEADLSHKFRVNALNYLQAAKILEEKNEADHLIAPCCHNLALALELFLKARLVKAGDGDQLKQYGHDLMRMWNSDWAEEIRACAEFSASSHTDKIMAKWGVRAASRGLSPSEELKSHLEWLSSAYGRDSNFALRYPRSDETTVPSPEFLIPIMEHVFDTIL